MLAREATDTCNCPPVTAHTPAAVQRPRAAVTADPPLVVLTLHKFGQGGTDRVCVHLANGFVRAGYQVEIAALCSSGKGRRPLLAMLDPRVTVTRLGGRSLGRGADLALSLFRLRDHLRARTPSLVVSTGNNMSWVTTAAFKMAKCAGRLVLKTTNPVVRPQDGTLEKVARLAVYAKVLAAADLVLTLSDEETQHLRALFPADAAKFRAVANPYVTENMLRRAEGNRPPQQRKMVLAVGRLERQKNFKLLLRAAARLDRPDTEYVFLGEGSRKRKLQKLAAKLGIADRVQFLGFEEDVASWYSRADLFVLSSRYEGLPAVVLEAMSQDCPVVSTDCFAAARTIVGTAPGCAVVERSNPQLLADAIDGALRRPRPADLHGVAERYSIDNAVADHCAAFEELLGNASMRGISAAAA